MPPHLCCGRFGDVPVGSNSALVAFKTVRCRFPTRDLTASPDPNSQPVWHVHLDCDCGGVAWEKKNPRNSGTRVTFQFTR
jgi:hypothetical protein